MRVIETYSHDSRIGVLIEVESEFDDSVTQAKLKELAHDLAMHIAAINPSKIEENAVSISKDQSSSPDQASDLLGQGFIKEPEITVRELIERLENELNAKIQVTRFERYDASDT